MKKEKIEKHKIEINSSTRRVETNFPYFLSSTISSYFPPFC